MMRIFVSAKPNAKEERVEETGAGRFTVCVKEPPREGKANMAIICALANHLDVAPSQVRLVSGFSSRQKVFEIL